jgi:ADP-heptose:LPS heptosyltransferase
MLVECNTTYAAKRSIGRMALNLDLSIHNLELLKKLLLIRLSSLGDILLTTPLLEALRTKYPDAQIDMVVSSEYAPLAPLLPGKPSVHVFNKSEGLIGLMHLRKEMQSEGYDAVLDLHNNLRSRVLRRGLGRHTFVIRKRTMKRWLLVRYKMNTLRDEPDVIGRYFEAAHPLGVRDVGAGARLVNPKPVKERAIAMAPGARHLTKRWPARYYIMLGKELVAQGYEVRLFGSVAERELCESICDEIDSGRCTNYAGELSLSATALEIAKCERAVTNDSGLMHVATAVGTPTVAIFGPTVREFGFVPRANIEIAEVRGLYCRPCTAHGSERCPEGHFRCMLEIEPVQISSILERTY